LTSIVVIGPARGKRASPPSGVVYEDLQLPGFSWPCHPGNFRTTRPSVGIPSPQGWAGRGGFGCFLPRRGDPHELLRGGYGMP